MGSFERINHQALLKKLATFPTLRRTIRAWLRAGVLDGSQFTPTTEGAPQGGPLSPLLANVYLHQLDRYWWERYGNLHRKEKERRRLAHKGNCALIRYADDWVRHEAYAGHGARAPAAGRRAVSLSP